MVLSGDTSGTVTVTVPAVAGTNTATLPAATGTVMVSGNMPAFSAYQSTLQSMTTGAYTKIQLQTKEFDTANCFDNTTNYRFTPNVAGYYQVNGTLNMNLLSAGIFLVTIYKNGSEFKRGVQGTQAASNTLSSVVSALIYMNGTTDYIEMYGYQNSGSSINTVIAASQTYFQASMVRSA
jgi:hypothetical protein